MTIAEFAGRSLLRFGTRPWPSVRAARTLADGGGRLAAEAHKRAIGDRKFLRRLASDKRDSVKRRGDGGLSFILDPFASSLFVPSLVTIVETAALKGARGRAVVLASEPEYPPDLRSTTPDCDFRCLQCAYSQI